MTGLGSPYPDGMVCLQDEVGGDSHQVWRIVGTAGDKQGRGFFGMTARKSGYSCIHIILC
jgi:hypothetical protein